MTMDIDDGQDFTDLVRRHTVLSVVVGWPASGLDDPDIDDEQAQTRGVFVPPTELFWHLRKPPTTVDGPGVGLISWEVEAFCALGLHADPAVYEVLASPLVRSSTEIGGQLRELTRAFLSQRAADAYRRATATEFAKASAAMASGGTPRWRQVADVIRALIVCEELLRSGTLTIDMSRYRTELLAVRAGEMPWAEVRRWVESLRDRSAEAVLRSPLPARPNIPAVQNWLMSVRRRCLTVAEG